MGMETLIGTGASLLGSAMQSDAASDAASQQAAATDRANALQQQNSYQIRSDLSPYRETGGAANARLAQLLGISSGDSAANRVGAKSREQFITDSGYSRPQNRDWYAHENTNIDNAYNDYLKTLPLAEGSGSGDPAYGSLLKTFTGTDLQNDPGYAFGLQQGQTQLDNAAARGGSLFSGAALKQAERYGQDYAGTKFNEAFNRDSANKAQQYNFLSGQQGVGLNAANMTGTAGTNTANQMGANITSNANAQGAAGIAGANAWSNGLNSVANSYQNDELLKRLTAGGVPNYGTTGLNQHFFGNGTGGD